MSVAGHREPCESRGSRTVLGARGGEIPPRDSTASAVLFITQNWRGKPLVSYLVIVQLIASTTTDKGLTVACSLDEKDYAKGIKVTDAEMAALNIRPAAFMANGTIPSSRGGGRMSGYRLGPLGDHNRSQTQN